VLCGARTLAKLEATVVTIRAAGGEEPATPDEDGLRRFLEGTVMPWFDGRKK